MDWQLIFILCSWAYGIWLTVKVIWPFLNKMIDKE